MSKIQLDDLTVNNNQLLELINTKSLPITYPESFYKDAYKTGLSQLAFYGEVPVGVIKAKLLVPQGNTIPDSVYIESLAVLEAYRKNGIATKLLEWAQEEAKKAYLHQLTLHVWIKNSETLEWYKKHGFEEKTTVIGYYKDWGLEEPDAVLLVKKF